MSTGKKRLLAYVVMGLSVLICIKLVKDIVRLWNADDRIEKAEEELLGAKREQLKLKEEIIEVGEDDWWEQQVRDTLKMAKSNEQVVIVPEKILKEGKKVSDVELVKEEEKSNVEKWKEVFGIMD